VLTESQVLMVVAYEGRLYLLSEHRAAKFERVDTSGFHAMVRWYDRPQGRRVDQNRQRFTTWHWCILFANGRAITCVRAWRQQRRPKGRWRGWRTA
jgi:hypothetical protein